MSNGRIGEWIARKTVLSCICIWRRRLLMLPMLLMMLPVLLMMLPTMLTPIILPPLLIRSGGHIGISITNHGPVRIIIPRKSLKRNISLHKRFPQAVIPRQTRLLDLPPHGRRGARFEPRRPFPDAASVMVWFFVPLATFYGSLLPQRLASLLPCLFIPHIVPKLGLTILLQKSSRRVQRAPIINNSHRHERFIQSFGLEVCSLSVLDHFAIAFVPRMVVRSPAASKETVVLTRFGDAVPGPLGAALGTCGDFFLAFGFYFGGWLWRVASLVWFGGGCHGRIIERLVISAPIFGIIPFFC